jgi:hypothetical protein
VPALTSLVRSTSASVKGLKAVASLQIFAEQRFVAELAKAKRIVPLGATASEPPAPQSHDPRNRMVRLRDLHECVTEVHGGELEEAVSRLA